jgi:hypothetical protein
MRSRQIEQVRIALVVRTACSDNTSHNTDKANAMSSQLDKEVDKEIGKAPMLPAAKRANFDEHVPRSWENSNLPSLRGCTPGAVSI